MVLPFREIPLLTDASTTDFANWCVENSTNAKDFPRCKKKSTNQVEIKKKYDRKNRGKRRKKGRRGLSRCTGKER